MRYLRGDEALRVLLELSDVSQTDSIRYWLRRLGQSGMAILSEINRTLLSAGLSRRHFVTLDIDATEICSAKRDTKYTYNKNQTICQWSVSCP